MPSHNIHSIPTVHRKLEDGKIHIVRNITQQKSKKLVDTIYRNFITLTDYPELQHNRPELKRLLTSDKSKVILIIVNNKIASYLAGEVKELIDGRRVFYISYLFTSKIFRKKGFASRMMDYVEEMSRQFNYDGIMLTCDTEDEEVYNFYISRGYFPDLILRQYKKHDVLYKGIY